jgi:hypothetical protein
MTVVFILSDHDEYGAEHVSATTDKSLLHKMIIDKWGEDCHEERRTLIEILDSYSEDNIPITVEYPYGLSCGWGGIHLHIVRLTESQMLNHISESEVQTETCELERKQQQERNELQERFSSPHVPDPALEGLTYNPQTGLWEPRESGEGRESGV